MTLKLLAKPFALLITLMSTSLIDVHAASPGANAAAAPWSGPFGGVPAFDKIKPGDLKPALEAGMAEQLAAIDRIAADPQPPSFENTLAALERSSRTLDRAGAIYGVYSSTLNDAQVQAIEREMEPKLAAFSDRITQNSALFKRIEAVYQQREQRQLTPEQRRLAWLYYTNFVRAGARLEDKPKQRLSDINQRLATLFTQFSQNVLADEEERFLLLEREEDLAGLPPSEREGARSEAQSRGHAGKWVISNTRSSVEPFLTYSTRRDLREKVWLTFISRGDNGDAHDNNRIITEILQLRAERAKLLGYPTHAHWRLENSMAKTPERAMELMETVWPAATTRVHEEVADMQALAKGEGFDGEIAPWDYRFYAEKVRKAKYDLDTNELKPYLQLEQLREGMFYVAGELFGFKFVPVKPEQVRTYHADVRVWQVTDTAGKHIGLWYFDPYARPGKRSGAWMNAYRAQERLDADISTIVSNNANFVKAPPGHPVLVSWDDATTLFHEFGHALHGLSSSVTYPSLSGTAVARDYVEFPSQLLEHWLLTPEVLNRFARHYQTNQPIPSALVQKIERARTFNQGFATVEYLSSALVDMKLHLAGERAIDPDAFERETLKALSMPREIVMRHRTPQFSHVFASDGYSAGYYSYLWADTITADAWEAFTGGKGPYDKDVAARLKHTLSLGNTVDPADAYRAFRGRDPKIDALMRKRGFAR